MIMDAKHSNDVEPPTPKALASGNGSAALERVVADLSDVRRWTWTLVLSYRDAADAALRVLAREGLIEQFAHPMGGKIWRVNGKLFGRTDGITHKQLDAMQNTELSDDL